MKTLEWILIVIVVLGSVHLGLVGLFDFDFLGLVFGSFVRIVYVLVGLAGFYLLYWASQK